MRGRLNAKTLPSKGVRGQRERTPPGVFDELGGGMRGV